MSSVYENLSSALSQVNEKLNAKGVESAETIVDIANKIESIGGNQNLIPSDAEISAGYFNTIWGDVPTIVTSYNFHWHFNDYFELESGKVYTINVPTNTEWSFILLDENYLFRGNLAMGSKNGFTFVCPPNIKYIGIVIKYVTDNAYESYMRDISLYENKDYKAIELDLTSVLNDVDNWEHKNIAFSSGATFETNKANGTNSAYIRYDNLIETEKTLPLLVMNLSKYQTFNIQSYDSSNKARYNWSSSTIDYMLFYYSSIALTPNAGSSTTLNDAINSYKDWLHLYFIVRKEVEQ